jgi:hypothetical protein
MCPPPDSTPTATVDGLDPTESQLNAATLDLVPRHDVCQAALGLAREALSAPIFNHSFRVFLYARHLVSSASEATEGSTDTSPLHPGPMSAEVLFVACILHDLGTATLYDSVPQRFEVAGADEAARLLCRHGFSEALIREAWLAIALHDSSGIAERIGGLVRIVRLAVRIDFGLWSLPKEHTFEGREAVDGGELPRMSIEKVLGDTVARQGVALREKAPGGSWPGDLVKAKLLEPEWNGVNKGF